MPRGREGGAAKLARPGDSAPLWRGEGPAIHRKKQLMLPVMVVVLGTRPFRRGVVERCSGLAGNVGFRRECEPALQRPFWLRQRGKHSSGHSYAFGRGC